MKKNQTKFRTERYNNRIKNSLDRLNSRVKIIEERVNEIELFDLNNRQKKIWKTDEQKFENPQNNTKS